jgi:hypothetical protein
MAQDRVSTELSEAKPTKPANFFGRIPAWLYSFAVIALVGFYTWSQAQSIGDGTIGYALDDAYIHMAIAKNYAFHGIWGVSPFEPVSASSSPGWILILTVMFRVFGDHDWWPLALNVTAGVGLAYVVDRLLRPYAQSLLWRTVLVTAVLLALPLSYFMALGMEHTLQALLVATMFGFVRKIGAPGYLLSKKELWWLFALCAAMVAVRVEDAVLIPLPFVYALVKKDRRAALAMAAGPMLALGGFAIIAAAQGFGIEPTSMLVKRVHLAVPKEFTFIDKNIPVSHMSTASWFLLRFWENVTLYREVCFLIFALLILLVALILSAKRRGSLILLVGTVFSGFCFHAANGGFGWYARYEGYLILFSCLCLIAVGTDCARRWRATGSGMGFFGFAALSAFVAACLTVRSCYALQTNAEMLKDVGWQQVQFGRFLNEFYSGRSVMLNDIGAATYLSDIHLLDVAGLGTPEIAEARVEDRFDANFLINMMRSRHVDVAMVYVAALPKPDGLQYPLIPVASWSLPSGAILGGDVLILAGNPGAAAELQANLQAFQKELPSKVAVKYFPLQ